MRRVLVGFPARLIDPAVVSNAARLAHMVPGEEDRVATGARRLCSAHAPPPPARCSPSSSPVSRTSIGPLEQDAWHRELGFHVPGKAGKTLRGLQTARQVGRWAS